MSHGLRGQQRWPHIWGDTFSDSIAIIIVLVFLMYRASIARCVAKWAIALTCLCKTKQGSVALCWGNAELAEKVSRDWGHRSDTITISLATKLMDHTPSIFQSQYLQDGVSVRSFKLQVLSLLKLPFSISIGNRSLNEHSGANLGLKGADKTPKHKTGA